MPEPPTGQLLVMILIRTREVKRRRDWSKQMRMLVLFYINYMLMYFIRELQWMS